MSHSQSRNALKVSQLVSGKAPCRTRTASLQNLLYTLTYCGCFQMAIFILLSFRHVCFSASGEQHQSFSEAILSHLRVSGNSFHILTVQFLFLCYILVSFFKRCSHSGKLGVADAGIASQVHFKLEALHVIIFRSAFPPRH